MFSKILIANRGEIACRIIKTARLMGIRTVAVYSDADSRALHVRMADEAVRIGPAPSRESYLKGDVIIEAARATGAQAVHPGYGFLSENEEFTMACAQAGIVFIGPSPDAIRAMGLKDRAKAIMAKAGVPVVPGYQGEDQTPALLRQEADKIGYPVLIKAVAGGGGKGMRLVEKTADFTDALASCQREAQASFGNAHVLIEKYITKPRHIEVQVFGDSHGGAVYLFERDCSLQRRHQKVVEEAPAPNLPEDVRRKLGEAAVKAVKAINYTNAGTIEFIMDSKTYEFYFMEMNTRLQVEHPVTEMITGQDLVAWQLRVAAGEALPLTQEKLSVQGHAFEVRLYAEDPAQGFLPQIGRIARFVTPPEARVDTGVAEGNEVSIYYDPMIAKIIVHGETRAAALAKMARALEQTGIAGLRTNQEFLHNIFSHPAFARGDVDTGFIAAHEKDLLPENYGQAGREEIALAVIATLKGVVANIADNPWTAGDNWRLNGIMSQELSFIGRTEKIQVQVTARGDNFEITHENEKFPAVFLAQDADKLIISINSREISGLVLRDGRSLTIIHQGRVIILNRPLASVGEGRIVAPMPGRIVAVLAKKGDEVTQGQSVVVMEAMKMEMTLKADRAGIIDDVAIAVNDQVQDGAVLASIRAKGAA